ncbi:MAG: tetratricopeptide repeat protein [Pseudomonadota bacterium]
MEKLHPQEWTVLNHENERTVLSLDIVNFAEATKRDGVHAIGAAHRLLSCFQRFLATHDGHLLDTAGDGGMAWFSRPYDALNCALDIQFFISASAQTTPAAPLPPVRIGIVAGKVATASGRIYGSAVNDAAAMQAIVSPGWIGVEEKLADRLEPQLAGYPRRRIAGSVKVGRPVLKGIEVAPGSTAQNTILDEPDPASTPARVTTPTSVFVWPTKASDSVEKDRLSAAVVNALVRRGFTVRIGRTLSGLDAFFQAADAHRETGGDYHILLDRNPHTQDGLAVAVLASASRELLLSRHFDTAHINQLGAALGSVASLVAATVEEAETQRVEHALHAPHGIAQQALLARRAIDSYQRGKVTGAITAMEAAIKIDPDYGPAHALLGRALAIAWRFGWPVKSGRMMGDAVAAGERAVQISPLDAFCEAQLAFVLFWAGHHRRACHTLDRALNVDPDNPMTVADAARVYSATGRCGEAVTLLERSLSQDATDPDYRLWSLADCRFAQGDYEGVLEAADCMLDQTQARRLIAAACVLLARDPARHVEAVLKDDPAFSVNRWIAVQPDPSSAETIQFRNALLAAGLPA